MIRYQTQFSTYEVDEERKLIRRLDGVNDPTPRQGPDGEWKQYYRLTETVHLWDDGPSLWIEWDDAGHGTLTSQLRSEGGPR